ncbi:MAG: HlyD family efflux transporter periplasmic adaptor subunit [Bdellovibrionota bacterium]
MPFPVAFLHKLKRHPARTAIVLVALIVAGYFGYKSFGPKVDSTIKTAVVTKKNIVQSLQLSGKVVPEKTMVITAQQSGRIVALDVKEGAKVGAGDLLFTMQLEASGQTDLMQMRSEVRTLEQSLNSASRLVKNKNLVKDLIGIDQVAKEESDVEKLKIELVSARERLAVVEANLGLNAKTPKAQTGQEKNSGIVFVRAPTAGIVTLVDKRPGDFVMGGAGLGTGASNPAEIGGSNERMVMVVADMDKLQVRTKVMETDLRFVKKGQPVKIRLDAYPDVSYEGKVEQIGGQGRAEQKAGYTYFDTYVAIDQRDSRLLPEMNATVDLIFAQQDNALTLPLSSVLMLPTKSYVRIADAKDSKGYKFIPIQTGSVSATDVQILSGLKEGDIVQEIDFSSPQIFDPLNEKNGAEASADQKAAAK